MNAQNAAKQTGQVVELPDPAYPMVTRVVTDALMGGNGIWEWAIARAHPSEKELKVMRIFLTEEGIDVYAITTDGKGCARYSIPDRFVRMIEEAMPLDMWADEMANAEEDKDGVDPEEPEDKGAEAPATNGQQQAAS